ncbi:hypothetical protein HG530_000407 [Fusarium avenaceum]|nr:hypothetical protein HG530_000407 [Fusarium avenaceum]
MKQTQLDQPRNLPQQPNIILKIIRLAKLLMSLNTRPSNKRSKHSTRVSLVTSDGHIVLDTPAVADAAPVARGLERSACELLEPSGCGRAGGHVVVSREEGQQNFGYRGALFVEHILWGEGRQGDVSVVLMILEAFPVEKKPNFRWILNLNTSVDTTSTRLSQHGVDDILISLARS